MHSCIPQIQSGSVHCSRPFTPFWEVIRVSALAGYLLWFYPLLEVIVSRRRDIDEYATLDKSALLQIAFVCICAVYVISIYFSSKRRLINLVLRPPLSFLLVYTLLSAASSVWSISPLYTAYRAFECLVFLLLISIAISNMQQCPEDIVEWIVCWVFFTFCCTLKMRLAGFLSAGITLENCAVGINTVGPLLFLSLFISKRKLLKILFLLVCAISTSTKIYMGFVIGLLCGCISGHKKEGYLVPFMLGIGVLLILLVGTTGVIHGFFIGESDETIKTGTGRIPLWHTLFEMSMESPLWGKGFAIGELAAVFERNAAIREAHNSLFSAFVGVGLLGLIPILLFFFSLVQLSLKQQIRPRWRCGLVASTVMATFISMFAPGVGSRVYGAWIPIVLLAALLASLKRPKSIGHVEPSYDFAGDR